VAFEKLTDQRLGEPSEVVRARVEAAREKQRACFAGTDLACNADMRPADVRKYCKLDDAGTSLLKAAMNQLQLSARAGQIGNNHLVFFSKRRHDIAKGVTVGHQPVNKKERGTIASNFAMNPYRCFPLREFHGYLHTVESKETVWTCWSLWEIVKFHVADSPQCSVSRGG